MSRHGTMETSEHVHQQALLRSKSSTPIGMTEGTGKLGYLMLLLCCVMHHPVCCLEEIMILDTVL